MKESEMKLTCCNLTQGESPNSFRPPIILSSTKSIKKKSLVPRG